MTGVYLSIITQALTYALMLAFFRNDMGFGGNNGFTDFKDILGFDLHSDGTRVVLFVVTVVALGGQLSRLPGDRPLARRPRDSRDPRRGKPHALSRLSGRVVQLWLFVFSAVLAGIAGALYVPQVGIINPSEFSPINSIEVVIWVAVGGRGTLFGAVAGAVLVNYAKTYLHRRASRSVAVRARRAVRPRDAFPAAGIVGLLSGRAMATQAAACH